MCVGARAPGLIIIFRRQLFSMGDDVKETLLAEPPNSSKSLSSGSVGSSWGSGQDRNTVRQVESTSDLPKCSYLC